MKLNRKSVSDLLDESEEVYVNLRSRDKDDLITVSNRMQHIRTKHENKHEDHKINNKEKRKHN